MTLAHNASDIELVRLSRRYGATAALDGIDLHIPAGSLTVVVGPSGCGKSTLLRVLSGLEPPSAGGVLIDGRDVSADPVGVRDVAMVFQDYALYPHMNVEANISFGLRLAARHDRRHGPSKAEISRRVAEVAGLLGLASLLHRKPAQLSGGQRQRVALARAIIRRPQVLLLDEPLSALDAQLRASARAELLRLHRELGTTVVLVTHDQHEALSMATHLVVMDRGRIAQSGPAEELYREPSTEFVASFVGSPAMNLHEHDGGRVGWRAADGRLVRERDRVEEFTVSGVVDVSEFTGDGQHLLCSGDRGPFTLVQGGADPRLRPGDRVRVSVPADRLHHFDENGVRRDARWAGSRGVR